MAIAAFWCVVPAFSQVLWDIRHLSQVKESLDEPVYAAACEQLLADAEGLMEARPVSVMMKDRVAASGDKHDYLSLARYFWPDSTKQDGLPYVNRDGVSNPELERLDRNRLSEMAGRVTTWALAYYFSNDERYAGKAVEQLRTWFLDKATRMNPNLAYAQMVPGVNGGKGRCYGLLDGFSMVEMLDAVQLLKTSKAFTAKDEAGLKAWFAALLHWMQESEQGKEESQQANNHSIVYDMQLIAYAHYVGEEAVVDRVLGDFYEKRVRQQVQSDGRQPHELWRTLAFGYSEYNLSHMIDVYQMAANLGKSLTGIERVGKAADFLALFMGKEVTAWPYQQLSGWEEKQQELSKDLYKYSLLCPMRTDLHQLAVDEMVKRPDDRFFLLYGRPDAHARRLAQADKQLRYLVEAVAGKRGEQLMPRCVEPDGSLRMVGRGDWCAGFYPGVLWQMYQLTRNPFWREQAATNTWLMEAVKNDGSSHDLGFMMYCSFGKAYELTGQKEYRDVVVQAARTLASRFDEKVGCIRSWSWGGDRWSFPVIIDNMMNLELLFEASRLTGDERFREMAVSHADRTLAHHFRDDGSSYHVVDYDAADGHVIKRITFQGYADESVWSRGQAWGLYGFTMCYRYTRNPAYLAMAQKIASFFFSQENMPKDLIPYWDMKAERADGKPLPRDASAAAVFASGLYELATFVDAGSAKAYRQLADRIVESLSAHYQSAPRTSQGFLLQHSTGNYPAGDEIDVPIIYADYYYLEALNRSRSMSPDAPTAYPCDYAQAPRFRALFLYDPSAEPAHVEFDRQALDFFHKLSYGEGFLYDVRTEHFSQVDSLRKYDVVVMLNTLPATEAARHAFEQYMEQGGGWLGFHGTGYNDANTHWPWYNQFLGCGPFLCNNWPPQPALVDVENETNPVVRTLPAQFVVPASEFYQFSPSPRMNRDVDVLLSISPKNYPFGIKDIVQRGDFPIVWTNKRYRMVYLNMGHGGEGFIDATQNLLFTNAFRWIALGER